MQETIIPCSIKNVFIEELEAITIHFDGTP